MHTPSFRELTRTVSRNLGDLRSDQPDLMGAFSALAEAATRDGTLDKKTKELIALALGVAARCQECLAFHTRALVQLGATRTEVEETLGMAIYMGGGPSLMYASKAMAAYEEFSTDAQAKTGS